jgi:hypothetical protein
MAQNPRLISSDGVPSTRRQSGTHLVPSDGHRQAADAFLRGEPLEPEMRELMKRALAQFGWAEHEYIAEARVQGESARIWDTTRWIIANGLAQAAVSVGRE